MFGNAAAQSCRAKRGMSRTTEAESGSSRRRGNGFRGKRLILLYAGGASGDNVRQQLILKDSHFITDGQFALFQTLNANLIESGL